MFGTLQRLGARPGDIEDLLQEIFVVLHRNWPTLDTTRSLRPWLFGVAFRVICAHRRRRAREAPHALLDPEDGSPTPEAWLQGRSRWPCLSSALQHVPVSRRSVVIKHDLEGLDVIDDRTRALAHEVRRLCAGSTRDAKSWPPPSGGCRGRGRGDEAPRFRPRSGARRPSSTPSEDPAGAVSGVAGAGARARASDLAAGGAIPRFPRGDPAPAAEVRAPRGRRLLRIALAASFAIAGVAVGAVAALHGRGAPLVAGRFGRTACGPGAERCHPRASAAPRPRRRRPTPDREAARPPHPARRGAKSDPFAPSSISLQRAHGAYTRHDFSVALTLVAAHARRFPRGHLAEQREALRVRSLDGAGRADEAHRAAAAFAVRFPRSVLLPRIAGGAESAQP